MSDAPHVLLVHHLKALKLPTFLREHDRLARPRVPIISATSCVWPSWS